ncbi:Hypothetical protein UVM_LOCUS241 [uncultured virus]|nr:Hypothetical protein UVM_LOCUS241 [uncultured virus]
MKMMERDGEPREIDRDEFYRLHPVSGEMHALHGVARSIRVAWSRLGQEAAWRRLMFPQSAFRDNNAALVGAQMLESEVRVIVRSADRLLDAGWFLVGEANALGFVLERVRAGEKELQQHQSEPVREDIPTAVSPADLATDTAVDLADVSSGKGLRSAVPPTCKPCDVPMTSGQRAMRSRFGQQTFRSRLEAQHAALMAELGVRFVYEHATFRFHNDGPTVYTPDFWLPDLQLFLEVKPAYPHLEEMRKCELVAAAGHRIVLMYGAVASPHASEQHGRCYAHASAARGMSWDASGARLAGDFLWTFDDREARALLLPFLHTGDTRWDHERVRGAFDAVAVMRFDHLPPPN